MPDVLITTEALREKPGPHLALLSEAGYGARYPHKSVLHTEQDTLEALAGFAAVIAGSEPYTDRVLAGLPGLRVISRNGVGYDRIEVAAATRRGVAVTITPEGNHQAVAEHAIGLMLAVARGIVRRAVDTREGHWRRRSVAIPLRDRTLGIVGLGRIGRSVAHRAAAFGMRLMACDELPDLEFAAEHQIALVDLETLLSQADFVTLHAAHDSADAAYDQSRLACSDEARQRANQCGPGRIGARGRLGRSLAVGPSGRGRIGRARHGTASGGSRAIGVGQRDCHAARGRLRRQCIEDMAVGAARNIVDLLSGRWPAASVVNPEVKPAWTT